LSSSRVVLILPVSPGGYGCMLRWRHSKMAQQRKYFGWLVATDNFEEAKT
jgi:hypothetical protein